MKIATIIFSLFFALNLFAQSQPGGFTQNWSQYTAGEFGPVNISLDHSNLTPISQVAPVGVHPRI